jgi:histidinol-phosphate/aromatic aminotransferase/cobyric acid decarboxylase-like protein
VIKSVFSIILERGDCILTSNPGWSYYGSLAKEKFCEVYYYDVLKDDYTYYMDVEDILRKARQYNPKIIVITNPHNPTGCKMKGNAIETIIKQNPESLILLDEAYWGFSEEDIDVRRLVESYTNIIVSRTFSKYYGLANMRVGYGFCNAKVKRIFGLDLPLFRESTISRKMAVAAIHDKQYYEDMNKKLNEIKTWFIDELNRVPNIRAFQSDSNFVAVKIENTDMQRLQEALKEKGILIRLFKDGEEIIARIAIAEKEIMVKTVNAIRDIQGKR